VYHSRRIDNQTVIYATHLDSKETKEIARLPFFGTFGGVNSDETLLVRACSERRNFLPAGVPSGNSSNAPARTDLPRPGDRASQFRYRGPRSMHLFTVNTATGEVKKFHPSTNWL